MSRTASALAATRKAGCRLVATVLAGDAPDQVPLTGPTALFVGAEGQGLPDEVVSACDARTCGADDTAG